MENKIMMPASYNVLSCEEMTYTEGGATFTEALLNWIPPIGWYMQLPQEPPQRLAGYRSGCSEPRYGFQCAEHAA